MLEIVEDEIISLKCQKCGKTIGKIKQSTLKGLDGALSIKCPHKIIEIKDGKKRNVKCGHISTF